MATVSNLFIDQGSDFSVIVTLKNRDGTALNLSGYSVASQMRKSYQSSTFIPFTASIYEASTGKVRLQISAATTTAAKAGRYLYDVEITSQAGERKRALEGIVVLTPEITR